MQALSKANRAAARSVGGAAPSRAQQLRNARRALTVTCAAAPHPNRRALIEGAAASALLLFAGPALADDEQLEVTLVDEPAAAAPAPSAATIAGGHKV